MIDLGSPVTTAISSTYNQEALTHLRFLIPTTGGQVVGVTHLDALLVMVIMVDVVLHKALVPMIPFMLRCFLLVI